MEVEAEEGGGHAGVLVVGLPHDGRHDLLRLRARPVVEVRVQLPPLDRAGGRCRRQGEEDRDGEGNKGRGRHCNLHLELAIRHLAQAKLINTTSCSSNYCSLGASVLCCNDADEA